MGLWRKHFHWSVLLAWEVLQWILVAIVTVGGLLLVFDQYSGANVCFIVTACFIFAKIVNVAIVSTDPAWHRLLFTFLLFGMFGIAIVESVRGINHFARKKGAPEEAAANSKGASKGPDESKEVNKPSTVTETSGIKDSIAVEVHRSGIKDEVATTVRRTSAVPGETQHRAVPAHLHEPAQQPAPRPQASLPHPVIALKETRVQKDDSANKITVRIVLENSSDFETTAKISFDLFWNGAILGPKVRATDLPDTREIAIAAHSPTDFGNWVQFSSEDYQAFKDESKSLIVTVSAAYPDRGKTTTLRMRGRIMPNEDTINVISSSWDSEH